MTQQYGTVKVDFITFTSGTTGNETDVTLTVSGLSAFSDSGMTITGDITARNVTATGTLSGATITGGILNATSITGVTGVFTTLLSGASITGELISGTSGIFTNVTGTTINSVTGSFTTGTFSNLGVTGTITGDTVDFGIGAFVTSTSTSGYFPDTSGTSAVGSVAFPFASGVFTNVTGTNVNSVNGTFTELTVTNTITGDITGNAATATNAGTLDNIDSSQFLRSDVFDTKTSGSLRFNDSIQLQMGSDGDVSFFYNNADFYIDLNTAGDSFIVRNDSDSRLFTVDSAGNLVNAGDILPDTDDTGNVGTSSFTWNNGQFTNFLVNSTLSVRGAIDLADSDVLRFGSGDDILMFYNGADFYIDMQDASDNIYIRNSADAVVWRINGNGQVRYAGDIVPDTDNTGNVGTSTYTWNNGQFSNLTINGTLNVRAAIDLADNDILRFGSSDDVEFFFNGTNFYLDLNSGGNNFIIRDGNTTRFTFDDAGDLIATRTLVAKNFKETVFTITWSSGFALNPLNGETQFVVLGGNSTPTQSNWDNGETITLHIDDGSARTITWTTLGVVWTGGTAPTLATTGDTVVQLWKAGNVIYGALVGEVA